jgi:hypothetical protein
MAQITYQTGIPPLNQIWAKKLSDLLDSIGIRTVAISSTYRSPAAQAAAMATNIEARGADSQKAYYSPAYGAVIDIYTQMKKAGKGLQDTLSAMTSKIGAIPNRTGHTNPDTVNQATFDIPPAAIPDDKHAAFVALMKRNTTKFIDPAVTKGEPVYHCEFSSLQKQIVDKGIPAAAILLVGAVLWYFTSKGRF